MGMGIEDAFVQRIKDKEGCRLTAYYDTRGNLTIGWGHLCHASDGFQLGSTISQATADDYLNHDTAWVFSDIRQIFPNFEYMPLQVQVAMCDMLYNNGNGQFLGYRKMIAAARLGNWTEAANEIVDSDNYRSPDLHSRYEEIQQMVRSAVV